MTFSLHQGGVVMSSQIKHTHNHQDTRIVSNIYYSDAYMEHLSLPSDHTDSPHNVYSSYDLVVTHTVTKGTNNIEARHCIINYSSFSSELEANFHDMNCKILVFT